MKTAFSPTLTTDDGSMAEFIQAMGKAVTGVGIVATEGAAGRFGITVSSMASVCADPPMLLVCLRASSPCVAAVQANGCFTLNLLHREQSDLADAFAGRPRQGIAYDFNHRAWLHEPGALPRVAGASAAFTCGLISAQRCGTHVVLIGQVRASFHEDTPPLLYCARQYGMPIAL